MNTIYRYIALQVISANALSIRDIAAEDQIGCCMYLKAKLDQNVVICLGARLGDVSSPCRGRQ